MRTLATVFLATLIVFALAPTTILADHEQTPQATPSHGNHHNDAAAPHDHAAEQNHNHDGQVHPHEHTIWQRLHHALFGRYHIQGTCAPHSAPTHDETHDEHDGAERVEHRNTQHKR